MLEVSKVSKHYVTPRGPLTVLSDVSFSLAPGEAAAIMGPSGSGKSSLLYILGGLEPPSAGSVNLDGHNLFGLGPAELANFRNAEIGFVFQDHCLLPQCSALENVLVPTLIVPPDNFVPRAKSLDRSSGAGRPHRSSPRRAVGRRETARRHRASLDPAAPPAALR